jgi:hypothetical protein
MTTESNTPAAAPVEEQRLLSSTYRIAPESFWSICQMRGDDGYGRMEAAAPKRWHAIPSWGRDGWDLGSWPYVVVYHRDVPDAFELAENVEGDVTAYRYPTREMRDCATDELAFYHWKHEGEDWVAGIEHFDNAPAHLRGAFSWKRADSEDVA